MELNIGGRISIKLDNVKIGFEFGHRIEIV